MIRLEENFHLKVHIFLTKVTKSYLSVALGSVSLQTSSMGSCRPQTPYLERILERYDSQRGGAPEAGHGKKKGEGSKKMGGKRQGRSSNGSNGHITRNCHSVTYITDSISHVSVQ